MVVVVINVSGVTLVQGSNCMVCIDHPCGHWLVQLLVSSLNIPYKVGPYQCYRWGFLTWVMKKLPILGGIKQCIVVL